ncbi:MAG: putative hydrolase [Candidatus Saccharibacteria bacterium]|nr:putative hydrolase [Candidatus Saccharibacteria bacterium]
MEETNPWKLLSSKVVYQNKWMKIREDSVITPQGAKGIYGVVESNDSVIIVVLNSKDEVYITKNFRYPAQAWKWELPGGGGDNEDLLKASKRELEEETGITAKQWTKLGFTNVSNGLMTERMATYLAQDLSFNGDKEASDELIIDAKFVSLEEIDSMIHEGELDDGQSITALYLLNRWLYSKSQKD